MSKRWIVALSAVLFGIGAAEAVSQAFEVAPREFDPGKTFLVQAEWLTGIGCPTDARLATPNATFTAWSGNYTMYTDPACLTGDSRDHKNQGLLLAKTGPSVENFASAVADIKGVEGKKLTELGYDIRKPGTTFADPRGSWCGGGAPRFNIETTDDSYFLGCSSPNTEQDGDGFIRLTWGGSVPLVAFSGTFPFPLVLVTGMVKRLSSSTRATRSSPCRPKSSWGSAWRSSTTSTSTASASARALETATTRTTRATTIRRSTAIAAATTTS